jgi:hypothetical protein
MLSAVCLVNYFEGGSLPQDRALLYKLCVEGLLHHWDQRRGIHSTFGFDEKLRTCRELALYMQSDDRAEYEISRVKAVFCDMLDEVKGLALLEHIRFRTGLLLERRPEVFGFAHLTFQEYLAARAIHEGNRRKITPDTLSEEYADARWREVIPLYCGIAPAPLASPLILRLLEKPPHEELSQLLYDAYLASSVDLKRDGVLREQVLHKILAGPAWGYGDSAMSLAAFDVGETARIANRLIGSQAADPAFVSHAHRWLLWHAELLDEAGALERVRHWRSCHPGANGELVHILHARGRRSALAFFADNQEIYDAQGPKFPATGEEYASLGEIAAIGLRDRLQDLFVGYASSQTGDAPIETRGESLKRVPELEPIIVKILEKIPVFSLRHYNLDRLFESLQRIMLPKTLQYECLPVAQKLLERASSPNMGRARSGARRAETDGVAELPEALAKWVKLLEAETGRPLLERKARRLPSGGKRNNSSKQS